MEFEQLKLIEDLPEELFLCPECREFYSNLVSWKCPNCKGVGYVSRDNSINGSGSGAPNLWLEE